MESLEVEVDVGEAFIGRVQSNMPIEAVLNAYPDWKIPGHVIAIIPTADRSKATVKVRVALDVRDARIVPDMGVRVSFLEKTAPVQPTRKPGVLVPSGAVVTRGGKPVAFVVTDLQDDTGRVQQRALTVGRTIGDDREVLDGLAGSDTVVVDPPEKLVDGARVKVLPAAAADNPPDSE
jgi:multidrug efflux pump subunit AcrA (membrane-fusion protein)